MKFSGVTSRMTRNLKLGIRTLLLHKLRSALTMLGMVFGVASVIAMLAIGEGSKQQALEQIEKLGTNNILVISDKPANAQQGDASSGQQLMRYGIAYEDADRITQTIAEVERVIPVRRLNETARYGDRALQVQLIGTTPAYFQTRIDAPLVGRMLQSHDLRQLRPVVVITESVARNMLGAAHVTGEQILLGNKVFTVIGVIRTPGGQDGEAGNLASDMQAFIPLPTMRVLFGEIIGEPSIGGTQEIIDLHEMIIQVQSRQQVRPVAAAVRYMFDRFHDEPSFRIQVPLELLQQAEQQQRVWNITLGSIAGISLLVGGIGIMNIMLATVTERTREIGVRRAIGASRDQIIGQFLTETIVLTATGGIIGVLVGPAFAWIIAQASSFAVIVPIYAVVLSLGISVGAGVVFGLYPAIRAASLDPIEALRHE